MPRTERPLAEGVVGLNAAGCAVVDGQWGCLHHDANVVDVVKADSGVEVSLFIALFKVIQVLVRGATLKDKHAGLKLDDTDDLLYVSYLSADHPVGSGGRGFQADLSERPQDVAATVTEVDIAGLAALFAVGIPDAVRPVDKICGFDKIEG